MAQRDIPDVKTSIHQTDNSSPKATMAIKDDVAGKAVARPDHRVEVAAKKRALTRARLLEATMKVFAEAHGRAPVIEDVVREAGVSRGTFYLHFLSLDEVLHALALAQSDRMTTDILPIYDVLKEPWQRFAVGFRLFFLRAATDPVWASFVTRSSVPSKNKLLVRDYMQEDLRKGREEGQFSFGDLGVAVDFMMGASVSGIGALGLGVVDSEAYMDECVRMGLTGLGCSSRHCERGVKFSREYLDGWANRRASEESNSRIGSP